MDKNNPIPQPQVANTVPPQPSIPQTPVSDPSPGESNKMILWLVIGLVVIVAVVGGIYFLLSKQQASTTRQTTAVQPQDVVDALDKDLSALNVEDVDSDFASIDQDLKQL